MNAIFWKTINIQFKWNAIITDFTDQFIFLCVYGLKLYMSVNLCIIDSITEDLYLLFVSVFRVVKGRENYCVIFSSFIVLLAQ